MTLPRRMFALAFLLVLSAACTNTDLTSGEGTTHAVEGAVVNAAADAE